MADTIGQQAFIDAIGRARANAPFLAWLLEREPELTEILSAGRLPHGSIPEGNEAIARRLRRTRRRVALEVAIGDLAGALDLTAVTARLSAFADAALDQAIHAAITERYPGAEPRGFVALALGKQGSGELNYSSDIDPILLYDPAVLPRRAREEPEEAAVRIARRVVELLQARDADGYVFRVDLRLRPSPEVTPIALPVGAAISYYESQALPWERAAFIRARACAGDIALGEQFLASIQSFVWRRALDFGAIGEIVGITERIRNHHAQGQQFGAGYDLKRGRGGIREIEFFAQVHQLIHGGREPELRAPATRDALAVLAAAGRTDRDDAAMLVAAYERLRTVEHRIQMIDDRQTHRLPDGDALDRVARLDAVGDGDALLAGLRPHVAHVATIYDRLAPATKPALPRDDERLRETFAIAGFDDPAAAARLVAAWRAATYPSLRSQAAQAALEAVLPTMLPALSGAAAPQRALLRFDALLARLPSAINVFRLLEARPALAALLSTILSHAPPLADALGRRPELLDGLIDASALEPVGDVPALASEMRVGVAADYQSALDQVRRIVAERRFQLGTQIVAGAADPLDVAAGYARVAEAAIATLATATIGDFARRHGRIPGSELVILGLGRLGGGALTYASDLDLIYLFTGDYAAESDGDRALGATLYYNRLAQRITGALSVATASGALYDVDTRLRPSGDKGPLAVSVDSFLRYQREQAWTWEHMALTRARPVFGSEQARVALAAGIAAVLGGARPVRDVISDAAAMRADMAAHKPPAGMLDAKLLPGGLVDLEFASHALQLTHHTAFDPHLGRAIAALVAAGLMPASMQAAHDLLTRLLVTVRLVAPDAAPPNPTTQALIVRALRFDDWPALIACFDATRQEVAAMWQGVRDGRR